MPPRVHVVRHAQGEHNQTRNYSLRDAILTQKGKDQCKKLQSQFSGHDSIDIIFASPLRRTIQTAALSFEPALKRDEVPFVLLPALQEVSDVGCDVGIADDADHIAKLLPELFPEGEIGFDISKKLDAAAVTKGWNNKKGYWAYSKDAISKRAADLRNWLYERPESQVVLVTHGAFAHFLTEDWSVDDPMTGTAWNNCEHREFAFSGQSTAEDAHFTETVESQVRRGIQPEKDPHVLEELKTVEKKQ